MTLYNNFPSKDALIAEVYKNIATRTMAKLAEKVAGQNTEEDKILALFTHINDAKENDRGCPMTHASLQAETPSADICEIVHLYKSELRKFIYTLLDGSRTHRDKLADQILLLLEGATAQSCLRGAVSPVSAAKRAVSILLRHMS